MKNKNHDGAKQHDEAASSARPIQDEKVPYPDLSKQRDLREISAGFTPRFDQ